LARTAQANFVADSVTAGGERGLFHFVFLSPDFALPLELGSRVRVLCVFVASLFNLSSGSRQI
jgi:hypothetical protein